MFLYHAIFPNGKRYIGITNDIEKRKRSHNNNSTRKECKHLKISRAILKYGFENIEWIVADGYENRDTLAQIEIKEICLYKTTEDKFGYNMTGGGEGSLGLHPSEKTKKKMGRKHTEKWKKEHSKRMSGRKNPFYGKHHTEEFKKQKSLSLRGDKNTIIKVSDAQVQKIRKMYKTGKYTQGKIAELFHISDSNVSSIVRYKSRV